MADRVRQTKKIATPIKKYKIDHTGPKTPAGGAHAGLMNSLYKACAWTEAIAPETATPKINNNQTKMAVRECEFNRNIVKKLKTKK